MKDKDLQTQEKNENLNEEVVSETSALDVVEEVVENNDENLSAHEVTTSSLEEEHSNTKKGSFFHYLTINIVDAIISGVLTVILSAILIFAMRAIGYAVVSESFMAFNLIIFIIVFILYKSFGAASKAGYTFGEKMIK
ncbi:hypothetical protein [Clostridium sp.]|uniref:hypothetical protein n=1 Tax=Clostridium sp. TaxID=1506 RepID=UPI002FC92F0B